MRMSLLKLVIPLLVVAGLSAPALAGSSAATGWSAGLQAAFYNTLAENAGQAYQINHNGCATLPKRGLRACFDAQGAHFNAPYAPSLTLRLLAYGRADALRSTDTVIPHVVGNRVSYRHGGLTAWWRALPVGFEQGFTIAQRPEGQGELILALAANAKAIQDNGALAWGGLHYGRLAVTDADGHKVPATLKSTGDRVLIAVNDVHATYPLTVDPLVWLGQKVAPADGNKYDNFGTVAVDGDTAMVLNGKAKVYVYTKSKGAWSLAHEFSAKSGATTVALEGSTVLFGAPGLTIDGHYAQGGVYVYTKGTDGEWSYSQTLTATDGGIFNKFGYAVALEGDTAIIGAAVANNYSGAAYVFTEAAPAGSWAQAAELTAGDATRFAEFGQSVALSGTTALVGASFASPGGVNHQGAAYVFTKSGKNKWTQTQELTASDGAQNAAFGNAVALDGDTAVVGDSTLTVGGKHSQGAAYVFTHSGNTWSQKVKLASNDGTAGEAFGVAVAIHGATLFVGGDYSNTSGAGQLQGATYVYTQSDNGDWSQKAELMAADGQKSNEFGHSIATDGTTVLIGAIGVNSHTGAAYFYARSNLDLAVSAPEIVVKGQNYVSQAIATNSSSVASPAVALTVAVPAAATFVSAKATQGDCNEGSGVVTCNLGQIGGNAGTATANITLKATGDNGDTVLNTASVVNSTPALSASFASNITTDMPPVASSGSLKAHVNTAASGTLKASDPDGDALTFSVVSQPEHGQVKLDDATKGTYTYTSDKDYLGADSFTFKASDGVLDSNIATISITVANAAPVAKDGTLTTNENEAASGTLKATDADGDALTFSIVAPPKHGQVKIDDATTGAYTYTPAEDYSGSDSFSFKANDGVADSNTAMVSVTVVNHPPVASNGTLTTNENKAASGTLKATDADGDALTFSIVAQPKHGQVKIDDAATGAYTYTPAQDYSGSDSFTFKANDGKADSNVATVSITVKAVNKPPVASNGSLTTDENTAASGTLKATDPDGDALTFSIVGQPAHGSVSITDAATGAYTYTPADGYSGSDSFTFKANDGKADSNVATVSITINAAPKNNGGGGSFGWFGLLALLGLTLGAAIARSRNS